MKFDGNRAWNDAVRAVAANREVLLVLAGVFFFLPGLIAALFLAGYQAQMAAGVAAVVASPKNPAALQQMMRAYTGVAPFILALLLLQSLGTMTMLALLTDQRRPTVAEAMKIALRCVPALIGAVLIFFGGYVLVSLPLGLILVGCIAVLGPQAGAAVGVSIDLAAMIVVVLRLSMTLPVIVIEGLHRPLAALRRSWRVTSGSTGRLLAFFLMLGVAYIVISVAVNAMLTLLSAVMGTGAAFVLLAGAVSGVVGAVTSIVLTAILAAAHRQLAGPSFGAISETFL